MDEHAHVLGAFVSGILSVIGTIGATLAAI